MEGDDKALGSTCNGCDVILPCPYHSGCFKEKDKP